MDRKAELTITLNHIILARGFDKLSMAQLAQLAGVSRATLYLYFKNKAEIVAAVTGRHLDFVARQLKVKHKYTVAGYQQLRLASLLLIGSVSAIFLTELRREYPKISQQLEESSQQFKQQTIQQLTKFKTKGIISDQVDVTTLSLQDEVLVTGSIHKAVTGEWTFEKIRTVLLNYFVVTMNGTIAVANQDQFDLAESQDFRDRIFAELYATFYK